EEDDRYIEEFLGSQWLGVRQKLIGINISASKRWLTKNWPISHIVRLCKELAQEDLRIVFTGTEKDLVIANTIQQMLKPIKPINACGKTSINQLACLIKRCSVYISPDSAPLHIAASQKVPFVALFGPTEPLRHLPPAKECIVIKKNLSCSPCYRSRCKTKRCMVLITPEEVREAVNKFLK
ncbi:MAG: glycosyltransferase family 9 protein, partial [Candidatus Omnitrophica bacterium]|nr:glycosyltransferase family 9 protein [Candidatus Omnitrophota bacterium]